MPSPFTWDTTLPTDNYIELNYPALARGDKITTKNVLGTLAPSGATTIGWRNVQVGNVNHLTQNISFDGTNYQRDDTTLAGRALRYNADGSFDFIFVASGANPIGASLPTAAVTYNTGGDILAGLAIATGTSGGVRQSVGGANELSPPLQTSPFLIKWGLAGSYADSGTGNLFQVSSWLDNSGSRPSVAVFGQARGTGTTSSVWGGNLTGVAAANGAIGRGLEVDYRAEVTGALAYGLIITSDSTGGIRGQRHISLQSNTAAAAPNQGLWFTLVAGTISPISPTGTLIGTDAISTGYGLDFNAATFANVPIRIPNNTFLAARNAAGSADQTLLGLDGSNNTIMRAGAGGLWALSDSAASFTIAQFAASPADGNVGLLIRRNVGGTLTLQQVSMGAADSGAVGFKLLRVPN